MRKWQMTFRRKNELVFVIVFAVLIVFYSYSFLSIQFYPFVDSPNHIAEATIYKYYENDDNNFDQHYTLNHAWYPNTFHLYFCSLPIFETVQKGDHILNYLIIISLPFIVLGIISTLGGNIWASLLSFLFIFNYNITYGFTGNELAVNFVFIILWLYLIDLKKSKLYLKSLIGILLALIFFMHAQITLFALLMMGVFSLVKYRKKTLNLFLCILYALAPLALIVNWWFKKQIDSQQSGSTGDSNLEYLSKYYGSEFFLTFYKRFNFLVNDNLQLQEGLPGKFIALGFFITVLFPVFATVVKGISFKNLKTTVAKLNIQIRFLLIFLLVTLCCYFFLPEGIPGQFPVNTRLTTLIPITFILLISLIGYENRIYWYSLVLAVLVHAVLWTRHFKEFDAEAREVVAMLPENQGQLFTGLIIHENYKGRPSYRHFHNYFIAEKKGISTSKIIEFRFGMIRKHEDSKLPEHQEKWRDFDIEHFALLIDQVDHILFKGNIEQVLSAFHDRIKVLNSYQDWHILSSMPND